MLDMYVVYEMTTRGLSQKDFVAVADLIKEGVEITKEAKKVVLGSKFQDFTKLVTSPEFPLKKRVERALRIESNPSPLVFSFLAFTLFIKQIIHFFCTLSIPPFVF
ncbi:Serine hydroxymethyltransferase 3 [Cardamine amara subsp. amara]|uniref:Serine hydroxymethyltransferase 3 n=1 Tax=Cardamine amara subsp. amara TaxID=228776 RepID=A0ABD0ZND3_CARAN